MIAYIIVYYNLTDTIKIYYLQIYAIGIGGNQLTTQGVYNAGRSVSPSTDATPVGRWYCCQKVHCNWAVRTAHSSRCRKSSVHVPSSSGPSLIVVVDNYLDYKTFFFWCMDRSFPCRNKGEQYRPYWPKGVANSCYVIPAVNFGNIVKEG